MTSRALQGLNSRQLEVASTIDGKHLVLAGAGSGKTRVLTQRICYLVEDLKVQPFNILAISFTKKASNEIKERLIGVLGEKAIGVNMGTFHSVCNRILHPNSHLIPEKYIIPGDSELVQLTDYDYKKVIKSLCEARAIMDKKEIANIQGSISYLGNYGINPFDEGFDKQEVPDIVKDIYTDYCQIKRISRYIDFNDILFYTYKILINNPDVKNKVSRKFKYILVDECQDLNDIQFELTKIFASFHGNYMMIGDDKQTIYSWRGSNVKNMMNIDRVDDSVQTLYLNRNYRSTKNIVNASNDFISKNKNQLDNIAYSENKDGAPLFLYNSPDNVKEADFIVDMIRGFVDEKRYEYSDFAIIFRNNFISRDTQMAFTTGGIPYNLFGGREFYDRIEIKTLIYYLRAIVNINDDLAYENIINMPKRSVGASTIDKIKMFATEGKIPLYVAFKNIDDIPKIQARAKNSIKDFCILMDNWIEESKNTKSVYDMIKMIINDTRFMNQYSLEKTEDETIVSNITSLTDMIMEFDIKNEQEESTENPIIKFLSEINLSFSPEDEEDIDELNKVTMTTVHSSKGLEFKVVFLIGLDEGTFPSSMIKSEEELEEERRAMYVAMTRAEEILFMSTNKKNIGYNGIRDTKPSRFLSEIPESYIKTVSYK